MRQAMLVFLALAYAAVSAGPARGQALIKCRVQIQVLVCTGDPHGSRKAGTVEWLSAPQFSGSSRESHRHFAGQAYPVNGGRRRVDIGIEVISTPRLVDDGCVRLEVEVTYSVVTLRVGAPVILTAAGRLHGKYSLGEKIILRMGEVAGVPVWAEIMAQIATFDPAMPAGRHFPEITGSPVGEEIPPQN